MNPTKKRSRPQLLTWLCIGSAIGGLSWIIMLLVLLIYSVNGNIPAGLFPGLAVEYLHAGNTLTVILMLLASLGLAGVYLMWQEQKTGFYLYTAAKVSIYYLPAMCIGNNHLSFIGLFFTSTLIIMYGVQFMNIRKKN